LGHQFVSRKNKNAVNPGGAFLSVSTPLSALSLCPSCPLW
jgi:hypothetical protein